MKRIYFSIILSILVCLFFLPFGKSCKSFAADDLSLETLTDLPVWSWARWSSGIAVYESTLYVALWDTGRIWKIDTDDGTVSDFLTGLWLPRSLPLMNPAMSISVNKIKIYLNIIHLSNHLPEYGIDLLGACHRYNLDNSGDIYVVVYQHDVVRKFDSIGNWIEDIPYTDLGNFGAGGIAIDEAGVLYISMCNSNPHKTILVKLDPDTSSQETLATVVVNKKRTQN